MLRNNEENLSNIVSNEQLSWIPIVVLMTVLIFSIFLFEILIRKYESWVKLPYLLLFTLPFIIIVIALAILLFSNVDIFIVLIVAGIPFMVSISFTFITMTKKMKLKRDDRKRTIDRYYKKKEL